MGRWEQKRPGFHQKKTYTVEGSDCWQRKRTPKIDLSQSWKKLLNFKKLSHSFRKDRGKCNHCQKRDLKYIQKGGADYSSRVQ